MRDAEVDEPRLLVAADDVDRESRARASACGRNVGALLRDAERVGRDRAHRGRVQAAQALAEAREAGERGLARRAA